MVGQRSTKGKPKSWKQANLRHRRQDCFTCSGGGVWPTATGSDWFCAKFSAGAGSTGAFRAGCRAWNASITSTTSMSCGACVWANETVAQYQHPKRNFPRITVGCSVFQRRIRKNGIWDPLLTIFLVPRGFSFTILILIFFNGSLSWHNVAEFPVGMSRISIASDIKIKNHFTSTLKLLSRIFVQIVTPFLGNYVAFSFKNQSFDKRIPSLNKVISL